MVLQRVLTPEIEGSSPSRLAMNSQEFQKMIAKGYEEVDDFERRFCDAAKISYPTAQRWRDGKSAPVALGRQGRPLEALKRIIGCLKQTQVLDELIYSQVGSPAPSTSVWDEVRACAAVYDVLIVLKC